MTTWAEARGAIPAQIAAIQASALSDEKKRKIVANLRRIQRDLLGSAMTQQEEAAQLRDEWLDFREHQTNASYFDEQLFQ